MSNKKLNTIKREFALKNNPTAYIISVHMRNIMATYGAELTKNIVSELFLNQSVIVQEKKELSAMQVKMAAIRAAKGKKAKKASNE